MKSYSIKIDDQIYGATPDERGPIGGGDGYYEIFINGDFVVRTEEELISALKSVGSGGVIYMPGDAEFDLTPLIQINNLILNVNEGVTIASNRGRKDPVTGEASMGAIIRSNISNSSQLFIAAKGARFTGLRLIGPNPDQMLDHHYRAYGPGGAGRDYYYSYPFARGIRSDEGNLEVDNCELSGFSHAAIVLYGAAGNYFHHNFIHHNQYSGLGYGIAHGQGSSSITEYNLFNYNRHSIAGSGHIGTTYIARNNVQLGQSLSHCFDMHETDGIGGKRIEIYNNSFFADKRPINIRGNPTDTCLVYKNWFAKFTESPVLGYDRKNVYVNDNISGFDPIEIEDKDINMNKIIDVNPKTGSLEDSEGGLSAPSQVRKSAKTDCTGALKRGEMNQIVSTSAQNDITTWWTITNAENSTANAIIANNSDTFHLIRRNSILENGVTYLFSAELKAGAVDWAFFRFDLSQDITAYFNLADGVMGLVVRGVVYGIVSMGDGWYKCYLMGTGTSPTDDVLIYSAIADNDASFAGDSTTVSTHIRNIMLVELPSNNAIGEELIAAQADRDFSGASSWTNVDINSYDETGDLTLTASAANQHCTLGTAQAPMTTGDTFQLEFDIANLASAWTVTDFDGGFTIGTINTNGVDQQLIFQYADASAGGLRITSVDGSSSMDLDNVSLKKIPPLALLEPPPDFVNSATIPAQWSQGPNGEANIEGRGININPYSEDFSKWTAVDVTPVQNIVGPNANAAATTLTADGTNGTLKYIIPSTVSGAEECYSIWMERISGTGAIEMTVDDGSTWVAKALTTLWQRFHILGTETAPVIGIRMVNSGDAIGIFGADLKPDNYLSSYIPTDGSPAVRETEAGEIGVSGFSWTMGSTVTDALADAGTIIIEGTVLQDYDVSDTGQRGLVAVSDSLIGPLSFNATEGGLTSEDGTNTQALNSLNWGDGNAVKFVSRWDKDLDDGAGYLHLLAKLNNLWNLNAGNESPFDGTFTLGTLFWLCYANELPINISRIVMYDSYLSDADIEGEIWAGNIKRGLLRMGMQLK